MLKLALILASLMVSPAALASDDTAGDTGGGSEKNICYFIGTNKNKCLRSPTCKWDSIDGRCEPANGGLCGMHQSKLLCDADDDCVWDAFENRCESI